jgi:hypothetical protein
MYSAYTVRRCLLALLGLLMTAGAYAAEPPAKPATASAEPTVQSQAEELICRDRLRPGSRIAMRTCATARQWAASTVSRRTQAWFGGGLPSGQASVSTVGQSVGASAFTSGGSPYSF